MAEIVRFPSWRYHATHRACIVTNQAEADALGPGWADSQSAADAYVPPAQPEVPVLEDEAVDDKKKARKGGR
jgi:hypothetical protein